MSKQDRIYDEALIIAFSTVGSHMQEAIKQYELDPVTTVIYIVSLVGILTEKDEFDSINDTIQPEKIASLEEVLDMGEKHPKGIERVYFDFLYLWMKGKLKLNNYPFTLEETLAFIKDDIDKNEEQ